MTSITRPPALAAARDTVMPALRRSADRLSPAVRAVVGYCQGWLDAHGDLVDAGTGKALRPALALLSARAGGAAAGEGIPAAVAVELVHDFSLLHDDIMVTDIVDGGSIEGGSIDGDTERRHWPSAWTVFGSSAAILAGDALLTAAVEVLLEHDGPHAVSAALSVSTTVQRLITCQAADLDFARRPYVAPGEYLAMAGSKTAALLSCAASLGAVVAGAPRHVVAGLAGYGTHLGLAFQLADDVQLTTVARLVDECGGRRWAEQQAAYQLAEAERCLAALAIPADVDAELRATARFVVDRSR